MPVTPLRYPGAPTCKVQGSRFKLRQDHPRLQHPIAAATCVVADLCSYVCLLVPPDTYFRAVFRSVILAVFDSHHVSIEAVL